MCGVSREIKLITRKKPAEQRTGGAADWTHQRIWKDTSQTAYVSGLFLDRGTLRLSYGSSDIDARLLSVSVADMEALFDDAPWDCGRSEVLDAGSGESLPPDLQRLADAAAIADAAATAAAGGGIARSKEQQGGGRSKDKEHKEHKEQGQGSGYDP